MPRPVKVELQPEQIKLIAAAKAMGASDRDLETKFGLGRPIIKRALDSDLAKQIKQEILDQAVKECKATIQRGLHDMTEIAMQALKDALKEGSIEAVKVYFKAVGVDTTDKSEAGQQQAIQVILPGSGVTAKDISNGSTHS